jgi:hypothetical protein
LPNGKASIRFRIKVEGFELSVKRVGYILGAKGLGFRGQGLGVEGLGFRVQGLGVET